jgi:predicted alpha/beta hydrolase
MTAAQSTLPSNVSPNLDRLHDAVDAIPIGATQPPGAPFKLLCTDGRALAARWFEPVGAARAVAVISPAAGVPQGFYRSFANWLAMRGYAVLTYDYRGIGESRQGPIRAERAAMRDWAQLDMNAAFAAAERRRGAGPGPDSDRRLPLLLVGHSFGGNGAALARGIEQADALLTVASQSGEWRLWPGVHRWVTGYFFHVHVPLLAQAFGHLPGWAMGGSGAALPKHVALEWARWGRRRGYLFTDPSLGDAQALQSFRGTAHVWNVSDDWTYAPPDAVDAFATKFVNASLARYTLTPRDAGLASLGHFGAFRRAAAARAWPLVLSRIEAATPALRAAGLAA